MAPSSRTINYNLRPAKHVERKMILEAIKRLSAFCDIRENRYVGLGAAYYRDFIMIHKDVGIKDMISIENDNQNKNRYEYNIPYGCIKTLYGDTTEILPTMKWGKRSIVWLDYDEPLNEGHIVDIRFLTSRMISGSMLLVTVNCEVSGYKKGQIKKKVIEALERRIGTDNVPKDLTKPACFGSRLHDTYRDIINNSITESLKDRNTPTEEDHKLKYQQLFNISYADGAKMMTVGGVFYDEGQEKLMNACDWSSLEFVRKNGDKKIITVPNLTYKEILGLNRALLSDKEYKKINWVNEKEKEQYKEIYRYMPNYVDVQL